MGRVIGLREDFDGSALRRLARRSKSAPQARWLLALVQIYDGGSRSAAARMGGVTLQNVPANISAVALPAKCPELNPVENVWQVMRDNWLSNRISTSYDTVVGHSCEAWNKLVDQPWRIMTIGRRPCAWRF